MGKYLLPCKECNLSLCENECVDHNRIEHGKKSVEVLLLSSDFRNGLLGSAILTVTKMIT